MVALGLPDPVVESVPDLLADPVCEGVAICEPVADVDAEPLSEGVKETVCEAEDASFPTVKSTPQACKSTSMTVLQAKSRIRGGAHLW